MEDIKLRYTFKRKEDGKIWQLVTSLIGLEEGSGQLPSMLENELWGLISRDLCADVSDIHKKDVFGGDIVKYKHWADKEMKVWEVRWMGPRFYLHREWPSPKNENYTDMEVCDLLHNCVEIIGNKFENKELLTSQS